MKLDDLKDKGLADSLRGWYNGGFATYTSRDSFDGEEGKYGGSFHHISVQELANSRLEIIFDHGSATRLSQAKRDLFSVIRKQKYKIVKVSDGWPVIIEKKK